MCWKKAKGSVQALPGVGKLFQDITPDEVRAFWKFMQARFGASVISKGDSVAMAAIGMLLDKLGVLDKDRFLKDFTTTLGRRIYVPFTLGEPSYGYDLWWQVLTCTHECQHVYQFTESPGSGLEFAWDYISSTAQRAHYEAQAYTCNLELEWWRKKAFTHTPAQYAALLTSYGCKAEDLAVVEKQLQLELLTIKAGGILTYASQVAVGWLDGNVARLKAA